MNTAHFQRNTPQRRIILEELKKLGSHPTATELYEIVKLRLSRISLGTIYRNLNALAQAGIIQKFEASGKEARFDGDPRRHYHLRCHRCGRVDDLILSNPPDAGQEIKSVDGWRVIGLTMEYLGICPSCKTVDEKDIENE